MKKRIIALLIVSCLTLCLSGTALAEHFTGSDGWQVVFTDDKEMVSTFNGSSLSEAVSGMQPGDDIEFTVEMINYNRNYTDWWMTNEVIRTLEDTSTVAAGGSYTYELIYTSPDGTQYKLYSSDTVGGDEVSPAGHGLHEATHALKDFFFVDTLTTGQKGYITMKIALDGETQGNDYQNTLADLELNFAVELGEEEAPPPNPDEPPDPDNPITPKDPNDPGKPNRPGDPNKPPPGNVTKTGDTTSVQRHYVTMLVSGMMVLVMAFLSVRTRRKEADR